MADVEEPDTGSVVRVEQHTDADGTVLLTVEGEVDLSSLEPVRSAIDAALAAKPAGLAFELSGVTFMDSSGVALLVGAARQLPELEIRRPSATVRRIIELTGLESTLRMTR